jgi:hypothetical protein
MTIQCKSPSRSILAPSRTGSTSLLRGAASPAAARSRLKSDSVRVEDRFGRL